VTHADLIRRETQVSVAINVAISAGFYFGVFGWGGPVAVLALGRDCVPQAFMIALMSGLVPGLLTRRRVRAGTVAALGEPGLPVIARAAIGAVIAAVVFGGGAFLIATAAGAATLAPALALLAKLVFGALVAAIVTPQAVRAALAG
jgi:hypothetical protein